MKTLDPRSNSFTNQQQRCKKRGNGRREEEREREYRGSGHKKFINTLGILIESCHPFFLPRKREEKKRKRKRKNEEEK
jgi:hypothetical protein